MIQFIDANFDTSAALSGSYDGILVAVSYVVATLASYAGLLISERIRAAESVQSRSAWLGVGSVAMGMGVWAMHFIAMLAFVLPIPVAYDLEITIASVVPAVLASALALHVMGSSQHGRWHYIVAGTLVGAGIGVMHYTGMAAMRMDAIMQYDPALFVLSVFVAVGLGIAALYVHDLKLRVPVLGSSSRQLPMGAALMGLAIAGMHYTAMGATYFHPVTGKASDQLALDQFWLSAGVTVITILIIILAVAAVVIDRRLQSATHLLRDSRERLHAVIDAIPAMISAKDRDSRYLFVNRYQAELYGVSRDEAVGKTAENLLGRKYGAHTERLDRKVIESGEALPYFEEDHTDAHGVRRELLATKVPLKDRHGRVQGVVTVALDISDRKRAEQALKESETRFVQAVRLATLGHWAWNEIEDRCTYCSEELAHIHGVTVDEYLAATNSVEGDLAHIHPDDREEYNRVTRKWAGRQDTYDIEYRIVRPDGKVRHVRELAEAIRDETGRMVRSIGTKQDITEAKQAEQELLEAKQRTEEASKLVAEKNRMLESLSNQLSKYLSPQVYASIFAGKQSVEIASKRKKLTVFFSDIADFTGITDSLESEELTNLLNQHLIEMSKIALDYGATIDKYVGDSIIAFFGDPETRGVKEDARTCVNMAIAMQRRMRELQSEWLDMGLERPFELRIGINTGFCTVGNFGSEDRMDYTIIGNEVNLAARLESLAEVGGILMAHETHALVKDTVLAEEGDTLTVKGFAKPVRTYSVVGLYDDLAEQGRIIRKDEDGLTLIIDRNKLTKKSKAKSIKAVEDVLSQLKS